MNKYEYAMHKIREYANDGFHSKERTDRASKHFFEHKEALQEIVERATPIKAKNQEYDEVFELMRGKCKCGDEVFEPMKYCYKCGQALDWSKE